jgi:DNA repair protein RecO (recombination protein O)
VVASAPRNTKTPGDSSAGFVLHTYPYRETSLIVETYTRSHGRVVVVAKGAKRPHSAMRSLLNPFQGLRLTWFGKSEMKTLKTVEHERIYPQLSGAALMSSFYMNELLLKLAHREDAHETLFAAYECALATLAEPGLAKAARDAPANVPANAPANAEVRAIAIALRKFELALLRDLGYALQLNEDVARHKIDADQSYVYVMERGPMTRAQYRQDVAPGGERDALQLVGKTLLDMAANDFSDPVTQQQSKQLMRRAINHLLGDKPLHTRQLIRELREI